MTEFTPGPWTVSHGGSAEPDLRWINGPGFESICDLYSRDRKDEKLTFAVFSNAEANARLIAAAPDLLAALEGFVSALDQTASHILRDYLTELNIAVAAINKARGSQATSTYLNKPLRTVEQAVRDSEDE